MHIHQYEKLWLGLSLLLIVGFVATVTYGAVGTPAISMIGDDGDTLNPNAIDDHPEFGDPGVEKVGESEYAAYVVARQFMFQPDPIVVPANTTVTFYVTSADVIHGFSVVGTNANTMVIPGEVAELTVEINDPGEYGIVCHEYCGNGHHGMEGLLKVVPADEYDGGDAE